MDLRIFPIDSRLASYFGFLVGKEPKRGILLHPCIMLSILPISGTSGSSVLRLAELHWRSWKQSVCLLPHYLSSIPSSADLRINLRPSTLFSVIFPPTSFRPSRSFPPIPYPAIRQFLVGQSTHVFSVLTSDAGSCPPHASPSMFYVLCIPLLLLLFLLFSYCSYCLVPYFLTFIGILRNYYKAPLVTFSFFSLLINVSFVPNPPTSESLSLRQR